MTLVGEPEESTPKASQAKPKFAKATKFNKKRISLDKHSVPAMTFAAD